jgi:hypothetical protein
VGVVNAKLRAAAGSHAAVSWIHLLVTRFARLLITPLFVSPAGALAYLIFSPRAFGLDFYGDSLCTSRQQTAAHPERVRAFRAASLKGWKYAIAHKEEIVDLIRRDYSTRKSREALLFEAAQTFKKLCEMTLATSRYFEQGNLDEAARHYQELLLAFSKDPLAGSMLSMCSASAIV